MAHRIHNTGIARQIGKYSKALEAAGMTTADIVKVATSLVDPKDMAGYVKVRSEILGEVRPAFMLSVVNELIRPDIRVEIEVIAAKA